MISNIYGSAHYLVEAGSRKGKSRKEIEEQLREMKKKPVKKRKNKKSTR